MTKTCLQCSGSFETKSHKAKFCSGACQVKHHRGSKPELQSTDGIMTIHNPIDRKFTDGTQIGPHPPESAKRPNPPKSYLPDHLKPEALKTCPNVWHHGMDKREVQERLQRIKDYNRTMDTKHHLSQKTLEQYLAKAGYNFRLAEQIFSSPQNPTIS